MIFKEVGSLLKNVITLEFLKPTQDRVLYSFRNQNSLKGWTIISDKLQIKGHSTGEFIWKCDNKQQQQQQNENNTNNNNENNDSYANFKGHLSLKLPENSPNIKKSGYIGVFSPHDTFNFELKDKYRSISFRACTEGRAYGIGILKKSENRVVYKAMFTTNPNVWEDVEIPFTDFFRVVKGNVALDFIPFDLGGIDRIGFIQSERREGPFDLKIDNIKLIPSVAQEHTVLGDRKKSLNRKKMLEEEYKTADSNVNLDDVDNSNEVGGDDVVNTNNTRNINNNSNNNDINNNSSKKGDVKSQTTKSSSPQST